MFKQKNNQDFEYQRFWLLLFISHHEGHVHFFDPKALKLFIFICSIKKCLDLFQKKFNNHKIYLFVFIFEPIIYCSFIPTVKCLNRMAIIKNLQIKRTIKFLKKFVELNFKYWLPMKLSAVVDRVIEKDICISNVKLSISLCRKVVVFERFKNQIIFLIVVINW